MTDTEILIDRLNTNNDLIAKLEEENKDTKDKLIKLIQNSGEKNYKTDESIYSFMTKTNDKFDEKLFKEENPASFDAYKKYKVSFDITKFKKEQKQFVDKYTIKGIPTYSLVIKKNKEETK